MRVFTSAKMTQSRRQVLLYLLDGSASVDDIAEHLYPTDDKCGWWNAKNVLDRLQEFNLVRRLADGRYKITPEGHRRMT